MITVKFGHNNQENVSADVFRTVNQVTSNASLRSKLGFGDNVEARVNGASVPGSYSLRDGDLVELVTKANSKG